MKAKKKRKAKSKKKKRAKEEIWVKKTTAIRYIHPAEGGARFNTITLKTIGEAFQSMNDSIPEHSGD